METRCSSSRIGSQPSSRRSRRCGRNPSRIAAPGEAQRQIIRAEIARLQGMLDQLATAAPRVRMAMDEPSRHGPRPRLQRDRGPSGPRIFGFVPRAQELTSGLATDRSESLEAKLAETLNERDQLRRQLEQIQDERKREQLEHEANVAELQAQLSQASLAQSGAAATAKTRRHLAPSRDRVAHSGPAPASFGGRST